MMMSQKRFDAPETGIISCMSLTRKARRKPDAFPENVLTVVRYCE